MVSKEKADIEEKALAQDIIDWFTAEKIAEKAKEDAEEAQKRAEKAKQDAILAEGVLKLKEFA